MGTPCAVSSRSTARRPIRVLPATLAVAGLMLVLAREAWAPQFTGGPAVRVTPNVQVEFKWITDVSWFGEFVVFDNPDATGTPVGGLRDEDAGGSPIASTQHTLSMSVTPPLAADTGYFFRVTAIDPTGSTPQFSTPTPLPPFFTGTQAISNVSVAPAITSAVLSWQANVIGYGSVVYGTTALDQGPVADTVNVTNHALELTGLSPATTYQFSVSNRHAIDGTSLAEATGQFTTLAPSTDLLPGRISVIKPGTLAKFVAKPVTGDAFALPTTNPVAAGGSLRVFDTMTTAGDNTYILPTGGTPPLGWKALGTPPGATGYKYKGAGTAGDPCKVVVVKEAVIKGVCRGTAITLTPPFTGDVGVVLSLGTTDRYCAQFGGDEVENDAIMTKRKNAPAPGACP